MNLLAEGPYQYTRKSNKATVDEHNQATLKWFAQLQGWESNLMVRCSVWVCFSRMVSRRRAGTSTLKIAKIKNAWFLLIVNGCAHFHIKINATKQPRYI